ncbi:site-specific DNA-methyltransferase [Dietzia cinnamea]|uniref:site-specific DNA-methyltransferase n=1 Tax=Dietzia cinnamea TaxID=321318 RepID=UPI00223C0A42|nr:site-specific DNA-methyltransferase [Dietzia cinnamea]MCT2175358.1 site-specific DNA-methyltransferase [Dietzia cinnamea]
MAEAINEIPSATPDLREELHYVLADLAPEAFGDGRVDVEKLREIFATEDVDGSDRFGLFWPGKKRALRAAQEPTTATLRPVMDQSKDWDTTKNVFIEGDNLEVLKVLQKHYHGKIKMIYIDPPYNTGKDFVYPDNFTEGLQTYLEFTRQVDEGGHKLSTNSESEGRYHSNWLNMMYPRLKLARNLLTDDGVIFISIDDNEVDNLLKLAKEVFGESNHVTTFIWKNKTGGGNDSKDVTSEHEYCLLFARNINLVTKLVTAVDNADTYTFSDEYVAERGKYKLEALYRSSLRYSDSLFYPIEAPDGSEILPNASNPTSTKHIWRWSRATFEQKLVEGRVEFRKTAKGWRVFSKQYLLQDDNGDPRTKGIRTVLDFVGSRRGTEEVKALFGGKKLFDYPKPVDYLKYYIAATTRSDDIILDFFAGSGSSAHAVMLANSEDGARRRFIQVQLPEPTEDGSEAKKEGYDTIAALARARIKLAAKQLEGQEKLGESSARDLGFRTYRLVDTNFSKWRVPSDVELGKLEQHLLDLRDSAADDATPEALLCELLLKQGYSLTEKSTELDVAGLLVQSVSDGLLLAYLDEHVKPTLDQLREVIDQGPARFVILEDAFQGDDELKTNLAQLSKSKGVELWSA